ncbi:PepSY-associated TM helix domain-containing protein [Hirschia baltica]|uniref:PepSY-associated TM helix domain protein n=1 Tax=Hirschia baltica (strain ATCC 49814 / DSM 5838 / IFAM 1418) TaxID=582402 RepID=C6XJ67_HIRBI|nr:PepSY-associated TM helix domain-containing protein [Hirschia baltica]ACT59162.1 conserved hypothetical protein [Hirschia baltica ATCC 49814]
MTDNALTLVHRFRIPKLKKAVIYKFARAAHNYLSAFAFMALMFFSVTGLLLNHPEWLKTKATPISQEVSLPMESIEHVLAQDNPEEFLESALRKASNFSGEFANAEIFEDEAMLRFKGVKGDTTAHIDLNSGLARLETKRSNVSGFIRDLHRGKEAGKVWRFVIDVIAVFIMTLSLIGFFLFFTMRFRLVTSMKLVGASVVFFIGILTFFVS